MCLDSNPWCIDFAGWLFRLFCQWISRHTFMFTYISLDWTYKVFEIGRFLGHPKHDLLESWNQPFQPMGILNIPRSTEKSFDSDNVSPPVPASVTGTHGCCVIRPDVEVKDMTKRLDLAPELWIGLLNGLEQRDTNILRGWRFWSTWGTCVFASCSTFFASSLSLKPLFEAGSSETKCE